MQKPETLGGRLAALRKSRSEALGRDLTVQEVATEVGIARSSLSGYENDLDKPGYDTFVALADYYGVSLDWLAKGANADSPAEALRKAARRSGIDPRLLDDVSHVLRLASEGRLSAPATPQEPKSKSKRAEIVKKARKPVKV